MRILAGIYRGRTIHRPKNDGTRPMTDKVRAALFNILGSVDGMHVLDAYAGSGGVGFEAVSLGAARLVAIESNRTVAASIQKTVDDLGLDDFELFNGTVEDWLKRSEEAFDLIVADPPYEKIDSIVLEGLASHLGKNGLLVVSHSSRIPVPALESVELIDSRTYGDSQLSFYRK